MATTVPYEPRSVVRESTPVLPIIDPKPEPRHDTPESDHMLIEEVARLFRGGKDDLELAGRLKFPAPTYTTLSRTARPHTSAWSRAKVSAWIADLKATPWKTRVIDLSELPEDRVPYADVVALFVGGEAGLALANRVGFPEAAYQSIRRDGRGTVLTWRRDRIQEWLAGLESMLTRLR